MSAPKDAQINTEEGVSRSNAELFRGLLEHDPEAYHDFGPYRSAQKRAIVEEGTQVNFADFDANLAAYMEWKDFKNRENSAALDFKAALTHTQEQINLAAQSKDYQALLQAIGKISPNFSISTREGCETLVRFLRANQASVLSPQNRASAFQLMLTTDVKRAVDMLLTDVNRKSYQSTNTLIDKDTKALYERWAGGQWCKAGEYTATLTQFAEFIVTIQIPRVNQNAEEDAHHNIEARIAAEAELIVKRVTAPQFLLDNNKTANAAATNCLNIFKTVDSDPLNAALEEDDKLRASLMEKIKEGIEFKEKKGDHNAKHLIGELRKAGVLDSAFNDLTKFKTALLEILAVNREALNTIAQTMDVPVSELNSMLLKLGSNRKLRIELLNKSDNNSSNTKDRKIGADPTEDRKPGKGGKEKQKTGKHSSNQQLQEKTTCNGCGILTANHGENAKSCPYVIQNHPNANKNTSTQWSVSDAGKAAKAKNFNFLEWQKTIDGEHFEMVAPKRFQSNNEDPKDEKKRQNFTGGKSGNSNGESHKWAHIINALSEMEGTKHPPSDLTTTTSTPTSKIINPFLTTRLVNLQNRERRQVSKKEIKLVLVDTGAIDSNYISSKLTRSLEKSFGVTRTSDVREVKTPDRSAPKFYTEGSVDIDIEIYNEVEKAVNVIKVKALIIDSPIDLIIGLPTIRENDLLLKCMNQILWGTREKWIEDKQLTPAQFKKADESMLNSIVDAIMADNTVPTNDKDVIPQTTAQSTNEHLVNCVACYTLVSHEEGARLAEMRRQRRGSVESPCPSRQGTPLQSRPEGLTEFKKTKPSYLNLCLLCSNAETRYLERLKIESSEFFESTMDASEVLDDTRQMLYQLQAKVQATIAETQKALSDKADIEHNLTTVHEDESRMEISDDESPQESGTIHLIKRWSGLAAALSSTGYPKTRATPPTPIVLPLKGVQPGDRIPKSELLHSDDAPESDFDWINDPSDDPIYATKDWIEKSEEWKECSVHGSENLQREIRALLEKYKGVFSSRLPTHPARVQPLVFNIDESKWKLPCNREPPRRQSLTKDEAIRDMIREMTQTGIIGTSTADAWSQVLLTAKPNGKWRFCIDYRQLNKLIENRGWPLPRIQELITRVGNSKPTVFGKMDLTSGYHQMPLAKESRKYTAFRSANGLHESNRVPMGLKNAGAYFQQAMADEVVGEVLYNGTELYLDDILVHGKTDEEFLKRLEIILKRCMEKGIVLSPKKCAFGMAETEILGHTINKDGSTFSKEKLQGVLEVKLPNTTVQLQSFLGLANYFRDHVKNVAELERPLRDMLKATKGKHTQLTWSESDKKAFDDLRIAVATCPKLYFWLPHLPVYLHTDACDTGIGAYLFQIDENGKELPIGFLSRALKNAELGWSTFEKEGYAIHQALKKFEYLLRDIKFTIRTDHRNLLYMNMKASDKVLRWKLDIQQFDFDVEHIPGPENIVADLYSRLCSVHNSDSDDMINNVEEDEHFEKIKNQLEESTPSSMLAALHTTRFKPAPATRIERPLDANVYKWLTQCHGHNSLHGHRGVEATLSLLKAKVPVSEHWATMRKDVRTFVKQCPCCQFMQSSKTLIATTAPYNVSVRAPMDRLNIDSIGPLPPDYHGNTYIIVIIDVFSRFVELYAAKDATALSAAKAVVQWIGRYGIPGEILTDNGTQYTAEIITQLCDLIRVEHLTILPYSHEENAVVERANREVNRHLRAIVFDKKVKNEWSLFLPLVQRIMNSSVSASTGVTPASIIFSNAVDLDKGLLPDAAKRVAEFEQGKPLNEYLFKLLKNQAHIIALAQSTQYEINQEHMRRKTNQGNQVTEYDINDYVIYEHPTSLLTGDSRPDKLAMHYRGPYRITAIDGSRISIQNLVDTQITVAHISQLRPFIYDPNYINPVEVARNAGGEFIVDKIVAFNGKRNRNNKFLRTDLEIKVHWLGFPDRYDTWEPYSEMKFNETFQQYC